MGTKKKATEVMAQMMAAMENALRLLPTHSVNLGDSPPKIIQVTSPKVMNTV